MALKECFAAGKLWSEIFGSSGPLEWEAFLSTSPRKNARALHLYLQVAHSPSHLWLRDREVLRLPPGESLEAGELLSYLQAGGYNAICVARLEEQPWTLVVTHEAEWQFLFQTAVGSRCIPQ